MPRFNDLLALVFLDEGVGLPGNPTGYANIPGDGGGETNWGISQRAWDMIRVRPKYAKYPRWTRDITRQQAEWIYNAEYYVPVHGDYVPVGVAYVLFDAAVNQGQRTAVQILQRAINVNDDGQWGPKTNAALTLAQLDLPVLIEELCWQRLMQYAKSSRLKGEKSRFPWFTVQVWVPRLSRVRREALRMGV